MPRSRRTSVRERPAVRTRFSILVDTNVLLDILLAREPWAKDAARLLDLVAANRVQAFVASHAVTTVYYVVNRMRDRSTAATSVSDLLELLDVVPLSADDFRRALGLGLTDYEDAVQVAACLSSGADFLVTRNPRDFHGTPVELRSAGEVAALIDHRNTK